MGKSNWQTGREDEWNHWVALSSSLTIRAEWEKKESDLQTGTVPPFLGYGSQEGRNRTRRKKRQHAVADQTAII